MGSEILHQCNLTILRTAALAAGLRERYLSKTKSKFVGYAIFLFGNVIQRDIRGILRNTKMESMASQMKSVAV
jgi:hypothetical protein